MSKGSLAFLGLFALFGGLLAARPAPAQEFDFLTSRPAQACAPYAHDLTLPGLWLGHFTGGGYTRIPTLNRVLAWRDDYSCFPTRTACARWQRGLRREFSAVEGYRTCLPLRAGGVPIRRVRLRIRRRVRNVVRAKY